MRRRSALVVSIAAACVPAIVSAQTAASYIGAAGGQWHVATNWMPNGIPNNNGTTTFYTAAMDRPVVMSGTLIAIAGITTSSSLDVFSSFDFRPGDNMPFLLNTGTLSIIPPISNSAFMGIPTGQTLTISGGGTVRLGGEGLARILNAGTLINQNNTIRGEGTVGEGGTTIINNGVVAANEASPGVPGTLSVFPGPGGFRNFNTLQARNLGILSLRGVYNNAGGTIVADAGGTVSLGLSQITGGTISGAGTVLVTNNDEWIALAHTGRTVVQDDLTIIGVIDNTGSINVNGQLRVSEEATLAGNGTIFLNNASINRVGANAATLTNSNHIRGRGQISAGSFTVINDTGGVIRADGGVLLVDASTAGFFNNGTLMADGGTLSFFGSDFFNGSGTIHAANNSNVRLNSAKIIGGSITSAGNGSISIPVANLANLENIGRIDGRIVTQAGGILQIKGNIGGTGIATLDMPASTLRILDSATLSIGRTNMNGQIVAAPGGGFGPETDTQFFNDGTIVGAGQIGQNGLEIVNNEVIRGDGGGVGMSNSLTLDPSAKGLTNAGIIEAIDLGIVILTGAGSGQFEQTGMALIRATDPGSNVQLISGVFLTGGNLGAGGGSISVGGNTTFESLNSDANVVQTGFNQLLINLNVVNTGTFTSPGGATILVAGGSTLNSASGFHVNQGSITINSGGFADFDFVENNSPSLGVGRITVLTGGQVMANSIDQGSLTIQNSAFGTLKASFTPSANGSLVNNLSIGSMSAALDITNRGMAIDYFGGTPLATIQGLIASGYAGGAWTGFGIRSSSAAANGGFGIGYAEANTIGSPATFLGRPIDASSILFRYTRYGDADLNGIVNISDFSRLAANFNTPGPWVEGDFNYNGMVTIADFSLMASNFNLGVPADSPRGAVPEPMLFAACAFGSAALALRRRHH